MRTNRAYTSDRWGQRAERREDTGSFGDVNKTSGKGDYAMSDNLKQSINNVKLGENTRLADFVNLYGCEIGDNSRIGAFVEIQKNAKIGRNVKVSSHTFICEGVTIEDDVFVGHNVSFINDKYPRATADGQPQTEADWVCVPTLVKKGAS